MWKAFEMNLQTNGYEQGVVRGDPSLSYDRIKLTAEFVLQYGGEFLPLVLQGAMKSILSECEYLIAFNEAQNETELS